MTFAPSCANRSVVARPLPIPSPGPCPAPMTIAIFFSKRMMLTRADSDGWVLARLPRQLTYHRQLPRIAVDALRLTVCDDECVAEEDAEHAVGGDGVGLDD